MSMFDPNTITAIRSQMAASPGIRPMMLQAFPSEMAEIERQDAAQAQAARTVSMDDLQTMLTQQFDRAMPGLIGVMKTVDAVFQNALTGADYMAFTKYLAEGMPGLDKLIEAGKLAPIAQLMWETVKPATADPAVNAPQ